MIPFPSNQKLITCWATNVSRECNWIITPTLGFFQIKIENIYLFKIIIIKEHGNVFKTWLCPNFLLLPKKSELPKIWGGLQPPSPTPPRPVRHMCLRRKKKERKPSDTLGIENNEWYQIKSEGWGGGSLRHNTMNTTDPFLPVTQTSLPVAVTSLGETMKVEGPVFCVGVEEGHSYS